MDKSSKTEKQGKESYSCRNAIKQSPRSLPGLSFFKFIEPHFLFSFMYIPALNAPACYLCFQAFQAGETSSGKRRGGEEWRVRDGVRSSPPWTSLFSSSALACHSAKGVAYTNGKRERGAKQKENTAIIILI